MMRISGTISTNRKSTQFHGGDKRPQVHQVHAFLPIEQIQSERHHNGCFGYEAEEQEPK